jgi:putative serine protease PepD
MAIRVECGNCFNEFMTKDEHAGRRMKCPECGEPIQISTPDRRQPSVSGSRGRRPAQKTRKAQAALPAWAFAVGGAGTMLIVGLVAMLLMSDKSPETDQNIVAQASNSSVADVSASSPSPDAPTASDVDMVSSVPVGFEGAVDSDNASSLLAAEDADLTTGSSPRPSSSNGAVRTTSTATPSRSNPVSSADASITGSPVVTTDGASAGAYDTPQRTEPFANLADLIEAVDLSVVRINIYSKQGGGNGSGYIVDKEGTLVTNRHVIEGATKVTGVFQGDPTEYPITGLYSINEKKDIAILKIECPAEKLHPLAISIEEPRKGTELVAFGAPLGLDFTASAGILSAIRKAADLAKMGMPGHEGLWFQHTVPISPGNSGGPLVNMKGALIGMNTMQFTIGQNLNFAISAADVVEELNRKSAVKPLESDTVPVLVRASSSDPSLDVEVEDIAGTEDADKYLAKLEEMHVFMLALGFDPTRQVTATVRSDVEDSVRKAKIRLAGRCEATMFVGMKLSSAGGAVGT